MFSHPFFSLGNDTTGLGYKEWHGCGGCEIRETAVGRIGGEFSRGKLAYSQGWIEYWAEFTVGSHHVIAIIQSNGPLSLQTLTQIGLYLHRMVSVVYSGARKQLLIEQRLQTILLTSTSCVCNNAPCQVSLSRPISGMKPNTNEASGSYIHCLTQRMKCITFRNQGKEKGDSHVYSSFTPQGVQLNSRRKIWGHLRLSYVYRFARSTA